MCKVRQVKKQVLTRGLLQNAYSLLVRDVRVQHLAVDGQNLVSLLEPPISEGKEGLISDGEDNGDSDGDGDGDSDDDDNDDDMK